MTARDPAARPPIHDLVLALGQRARKRRRPAPHRGGAGRTRRRRRGGPDEHRAGLRTVGTPPDGAFDPRALANPLVAGAMGLQFDAGVPTSELELRRDSRHLDSRHLDSRQALLDLHR